MKKMTSVKKDAFALFPGVLDGIANIKRQQKTDKTAVLPPSPPDISWLKTGQQEADNQTPDVPLALTLMNNKKRESMVTRELDDMGYRFKTSNSPEEAIDQIKSNDIAILIQHTDFEEGALSDSIFHNYVNKLSMTKRRSIFYILTGPCFHTLYNLEALSNSVNLVVNDRDLVHLRLIMRKSLRDYEELFGSFINQLNAAVY